MKFCGLFLAANLVGAMFCLTANAKSAPKNPPPAQPTLTESGIALKARYTEMLSSLKAEIIKALPNIDPQKKAALEKARAAVKGATDDKNKAQQNASKVKEAQALVEHAKGKWIGGAEKGIAQAQAALKKAKTEAETKAANAELAKWQANKEDGLKALKERQAALEQAKLNEEKFRQANQAAAEALAKAQADELAAAKALLADVRPMLSSDRLDAKLVKAVVLIEATPTGLALFAQQGAEQTALVDQLLNNTELMKEMLVAGGATGGNYGQAMQILANIRKASPQSTKGMWNRVALATALAHATPIAQRNTEAETDEKSTPSKFVDPVKRYLHYEKAFANGELDPAFPTLTTWEYRFTVDSYASDEILAWGREMLRNYRPDHIINSNYGWRYTGMVRTDVAYRHSNEYQDIPTLNFFQNICKNGGICGRRAFFGRFITQAFGLPARPFTQPKHAALARWTPTGWVVNLGASWPVGWFPEQTGPEFLQETQARKLPQEYLRVQRADWVSTVLGEAKKPAKKDHHIGTWAQMAQFEEKLIVATAKPTELAALGSDLAEANESADTKAEAVEKATITPEDKKISLGPKGEIMIPAAACGGGNQLIKSFSGGLQLICGPKPITCTVEVPADGKYKLTAKVVTVHGDQTLSLTLNNGNKVDLPIPFTVGAWQTSAAVEVQLVKGKNTLNFDKPNQAFALKEFVLVPVK